MNTGSTTADYKIIHEAEGNRYRFYCGQSGIAVCTTSPLVADTPEEELRAAWDSQGREHFNRCRSCGRWVSDLMFNVDTSECVVCSPWEEHPNFCPHCGGEVPKNDSFCRKCGGKLQYKGE